MSAVTWALSESYPEAAARSYLAALILDDAGDSATAGHLYGVAAECAVKSTLEHAGITIDRASGLRVHFPHLTQAIALHGMSRHVLPLLNTLSGPPVLLSDYTIHSRYAADENIDKLLCTTWANDTKSIFLSLGYPI
jgi:hypothetical protein